jgi:hypothetical protein
MFEFLTGHLDRKVAEMSHQTWDVQCRFFPVHREPLRASYQVLFLLLTRPLRLNMGKGGRKPESLHLANCGWYCNHFGSFHTFWMT